MFITATYFCLFRANHRTQNSVLNMYWPIDGTDVNHDSDPICNNMGKLQNIEYCIEYNIYYEFRFQGVNDKPIEVICVLLITYIFVNLTNLASLTLVMFAPYLL